MSGQYSDPAEHSTHLWPLCHSRGAYQAWLVRILGTCIHDYPCTDGQNKSIHIWPNQKKIQNGRDFLPLLPSRQFKKPQSKHNRHFLAFTFLIFLDLSWHPGQAKHRTLGVRPQRNVGKLSPKLLKEPKEVNFPSDMLHHASSCFIML